jgi:Fur family peroxide stress response transcriptional regulator
MSRRVDAMTGALRDEGFRITHQRLEVIREIAATDEHPDVESVYRGVSARVPTVSLDTVYRTLGTLAELGLVTRVTTTSGVARYDANSAHHHHFVCLECGVVRDIESDELDAVKAPEQAATMGSVESVDVQLRGVCRACAGTKRS